MFLLTLLSTIGDLFVLIVIRVWERQLPNQPKRVIRIVLGPDSPDRQTLMKDIDSLADVRRADFIVNPRHRTIQINLFVGFKTQAQLHRLLAHLEGLPDLRRLSVSHRGK